MNARFLRADVTEISTEATRSYGTHPKPYYTSTLSRDGNTAGTQSDLTQQMDSHRHPTP